MSGLVIAARYFEDHPDERDHVMKAFFAYHTEHFSEHPSAHNFTRSFPLGEVIEITDPLRATKCEWCGRSRENVRWDGLKPECQSRPSLPTISDAIQSEWEKAENLFQKAKEHVPAIVRKRGMSSETLKFMHDTHGYDIETVASIVEIPTHLNA